MIYKLGRNEIEIYDSIQELPILRFKKFNKYQMVASEIGSTFEDYDNRTVRALQFIKKGMNDEAIKELDNRRETVFNAYNSFYPLGNSFAVLVKRINDVDYNDFSPSSLDKCIQHLDKIGLNNYQMVSKLKEVKKKIETELSVYYPKSFPKNGNSQQVSLRAKKASLMLDMIIENEKDHEKNLFDIEKEILETDKPNVWNVHKDNNMERSIEVDFQIFALSVCAESSIKIDEVSTFTFYAEVERLTSKKTN